MKILSAFPGAGKSYFAAQHPEVYDIDAVEWAAHRAQYPNSVLALIASTFIPNIEAALTEGKLVTISSHRELADALTARGHEVIYAYPTVDQRADYHGRFTRRGDQHIGSIVSRWWDIWLEEAASRPYVRHVVLGPGQYISDVITVDPQYGFKLID